MPSITTGDGASIAYALDGPADAPVLVLANSIGTTMRMWDPQLPAFAAGHRVLRYDYRGHGASGGADGPLSLDRLGRDVVELLDALEIARASFVGLSLGGFVGQWLGVHVPERIDRLVLANTSSYLGPAPPWDAQIAETLAAPDLTATAAAFLSNWFAPGTPDAVTAPFRADLLAVDPRGLAGCLAAVRDADMRRTVALVQAPTLVVTGRHDPVTVPEHGALIAETIPGARLIELDAVHLANVERAEEFTAAVGGFLAA